MAAAAIAAPLIAAKLAGWAYDFKKGGAVLVRRGSGCLIRSATGRDIRTAVPRPLDSPLDEATLIRHLRHHERPVRYMYLDTNCGVTIGVGHLLPGATDAAALRLFWLGVPPRTGVARGALRPASDEDKRRAWRAVHAKRDWARRGHTAFRKVTRLVMPDDAMVMLLVRDIGRTRTELSHRTQFRRFKTFPPPAQLALIDMAFNPGVAGPVKKFPKFSAAVARRDWKVAAGESHRKQPNERRNGQVRAWLEQAAEREPFFLDRACALRLKHLHVGAAG